MFAELRSLPRCAEKLRSLLSLTDASDMVLCFVSCTSLMTFGVEQRSAGWLLGRLLTILFMPGITAMLASTVEQCCLLLPLRWGAGPMAMLLWLNW
jgi:hypothetical protein